MIMANHALWRAGFLNFLWINVSEIFRYFGFVMPMMREAIPERSGVAPMSWGIFMMWGIWDLILICIVTGSAWLLLAAKGVTWRNAVIAGVGLWLGIFVILWFGLFNMNLADWRVLAVALPLSLLEMVIAALIVFWVMRKNPGALFSR